MRKQESEGTQASMNGESGIHAQIHDQMKGSMHEKLNSHVIQPEHVQTIQVCHMEMSEGNTFKKKICSRIIQFSY